ncbi:MAG: hypothetical protein WCA11_07230 [Terracidiphilus sp.]
MRISNAMFILAICSSTSIALAAQSPSPAVPAQAPPLPRVVPSGLLQPSLDTVQQTLGALRLEKWKRGTVRDEAEQNIGGILRDVKENLPPLLRDADAAPGTLSKVLPVSRNVNALYDVLLRVVEASRVSAPGDQATQLQQALITLGDARRALDDHLLDAATAQEKQVTELRVTVQTQAQTVAKLNAKPAPVAAPCPTPKPVRRARKKPKPPAATPQKSPVPATTTSKPGM